MAWINPLDRLPQVPQDWANHIIYGGILGTGVMLSTPFLPMPYPAAWMATLTALVVTAIKKAFDYLKEGESLAMCVGKTVATALWPATWALIERVTCA